MRRWFSEAAGEIAAAVRLLVRTIAEHVRSPSRVDWLIICGGVLLSILTIGIGIMQTGMFSRSSLFDPSRIPDEALMTGGDISLAMFQEPVRDMPGRFPARTHKPKIAERYVNGGPDPDHFFPAHDLVEVHDPRVWWESENDDHTGDTENDHIMHRALEVPLRRLIELVVAKGGTLKVQDTYRESGIHNHRSLHKEGRAIDITCDELGLEMLARLAWAAGFGWVYHEVPKRGGAHVHASVPAEGMFLTDRQRQVVEAEIMRLHNERTATQVAQDG